MGQFLHRPYQDASKPLPSGNLRCKFDGLVEIFGVDQDEATDLFFGFGKRPVGDMDFAILYAPYFAGSNRLERRSRQEFAALAEFFVMIQADVVEFLGLLFRQPRQLLFIDYY